MNFVFKLLVDIVILFPIVFASCSHPIKSKILDILSEQKHLSPFAYKSAPVEKLVCKLENEFAEVPNVTREHSFPKLWNLLEGNWLLLYTNNAESSANTRKFPQLTSLKTVEQNIDTSRPKPIKHVLKFDSFTVTLEHGAKVQSSTSPAQVALDFDYLETPFFRFPVEQLVPFPLLRRGYFDVSDACQLDIFSFDLFSPYV